MTLAILGFLIVMPMAVFVVVGIAISGPRYRGRVSDHFDGARFHNPQDIKPRGGLDVLKWMTTRKKGSWAQAPDNDRGPYPLRRFDGGVRITFVNHSTFLIQLNGLNILTDPVWSLRASPFRWIGPKRMKPPGIRFEDLPRIHVVILTHNHYDHLDIPTMRMIFAGHHPRIIAPLGVKAYLERNGIRGAEELDWWQERMVGNELSIRAVPAQHFSGRGFLDRDATLWCGYVLRNRSRNIYFAGDTGYNPVTFREIARRCGPAHISFLPVGAYKPRWFMSPIHVSPEESVIIHKELGSDVSIAMHFGTFALADEGQDEPAKDLGIALRRSGIDSDRFIVPAHGEVRVFEWPDE